MAGEAYLPPYLVYDREFDSGECLSASLLTTI